jgi:hypothetical protein
MFGHRPVGWGRHAGAVFAAAFVNSTVQAGVAFLLVFAAMGMTGGSYNPPPASVVAIALLALWVTMFFFSFALMAIGFTIARTTLTLFKRNFGAAYPAIGLVLGIVEASVVGALKGAVSPRDFVFAAAMGVLGGFVYWLVASRDREVVTDEARARTAAAFS